MTRARWGETSEDMLQCLLKAPMTASALADEIETSLENASATLTRLHRQGHVLREKIKEGKITIDKEEKVYRPRWVYSYSISPRGENRLKFISGVTRGKRKRSK